MREAQQQMACYPLGMGYMSVILAAGWCGQEDSELLASLGYVARHCLETEQKANSFSSTQIMLACPKRVI